MKNKFYNLIPWILLVLLIGGVMYFLSQKRSDSINNPVTALATTTVYTNTEYGFSFTLPLSWGGYSIVESEWNGYIETGPIVSIRHPDWKSETPRQDIPIMIFTLKQWDDMQADKFHVGAAPINPSELGRNTIYVFALPARYNYAFSLGFEEVDRIIQSKPLKAF